MSEMSSTASVGAWTLRLIGGVGVGLDALTQARSSVKPKQAVPLDRAASVTNADAHSLSLAGTLADHDARVLSQTDAKNPRDDARAAIAKLAKSAASGDETAFSALAHQLRPAYTVFFRERCQNKMDLVDDLTQKSLLGLWQALKGGRYDPTRSAITTFAYAVGHKVWLQHMRATGRRDAAVDRYTRLVAVSRTAPENEDSDSMAHGAVLDALRSALSTPDTAAQLTDDERWLLRAWAGGESDRVLAKKMGIAASNVNVRKQRAYAKLKGYLVQLGLMGNA
ncbi:MAG: RNA polymerase sigma factor [Phycisphaerales bacterium]